MSVAVKSADANESHSDNSVIPYEGGDAPRDVSTKAFPDGYTDAHEHDIKCLCCCSIPTGANWLFCGACFGLVQAFIRLIIIAKIGGQKGIPIEDYLMGPKPYYMIIGVLPSGSVAAKFTVFVGMYHYYVDMVEGMFADLTGGADAAEEIPELKAIKNLWSACMAFNWIYLLLEIFVFAAAMFAISRVSMKPIPDGRTVAARDMLVKGGMMMATLELLNLFMEIIFFAAIQKDAKVLWGEIAPVIMQGVKIGLFISIGRSLICFLFDAYFTMSFRQYKNNAIVKGYP